MNGGVGCPLSRSSPAEHPFSLSSQTPAHPVNHTGPPAPGGGQREPPKSYLCCKCSVGPLLSWSLEPRFFLKSYRINLSFIIRVWAVGQACVFRSSHHRTCAALTHAARHPAEVHTGARMRPLPGTPQLPASPTPDLTGPPRCSPVNVSQGCRGPGARPPVQPPASLGSLSSDSTGGYK